MRTAFFAVATLLVATHVQASPFSQSEYVVPTLKTCSDHLRLDNDTGCLWAWGEAEIYLGIASDSENVFARNLKIGVVAHDDTDFVGVELGLTAADQYGWNWIYNSDTDVGWESKQYLRLDEAYVKFARDHLLMSVGRQKTIANFYDDESLADFYLLGPTVADSGLRSDFSSFVGGNGVQVFAGGPDGWSGGLAIEALGEASWSESRFNRPEANGSLVGVVNYESAALSAHSTLIATGLLDAAQRRIFTHSGVSVDMGTFEAVAALATEHDLENDAFHRDWLVSVAANLNDLRFVLRAQDGYVDAREYEVTAEWAVSDALGVGMGRIWNLQQDFESKTSGVWLKATLLEGLALRAGLYFVETPFDDLVTARGAAVWSPNDTTEFEAESRWNDEGAYVLTVAVRQRVN